MFRYTRDVHEPEFLIPRRVFEDGSFDTYSLPYFYDRQEINERKKRSTETGEQELEADKVHLVLPFNGIEHHVELNPYHEFISPDMVIEKRGTGLRTNLNEALRFKRASDRQCHYRGFVRGHRTSKAALSLCDGVVRKYYPFYLRLFLIKSSWKLEGIKSYYRSLHCREIFPPPAPLQSTLLGSKIGMNTIEANNVSNLDFVVNSCRWSSNSGKISYNWIR